MACEGCEERRKWLKERLDEANERTKQLIRKLTNASNEDSRTK